ncbi:MAG: DUF4922 domain-containing protein [Porphyromonadaceae bacterium CG2_30_38_12]|nr:MAG: DUF4922 domain-containing protein [Porphyromonadaceae bacterium CG2_30_38_12]
MNQQARALFLQQSAEWELARCNFEGLKSVQTKSFHFDDFEVKIQFNPARIISSGARTDVQSIASRPCFLCVEHRPYEQQAINLGNFSLLVNPFPIFPEHFTIALNKHLPQQIRPYFADMLLIAKDLSDYLIFYNGPQCGASAPDHAHFQAGTKNFLPLVNDYKRLHESHTDLLVSTEKMQLFQFKNYLRTVYCIETADVESAQDAFVKLYAHFQTDSTLEPLMNIVCVFENDKWIIFVIPRKAFRPRQYYAPENQKLLISPATVEMCGIFITPVESHFQRITKADVMDILQQIAF